MALFDWNNDGKKNWQDNMIEYQIYKNSTSKKNNSSYTPSSGMSSFGVIISAVGGLFLQALLYELLGIDASDVPALVIIILWLVFSTIIAIVAEIIGL